MSGRWLPALLAVALAALACTPTTTLPTTTTTARATPSIDILEAIRFREEFGLRADEAYVRAVAVDQQASSTAFGVPLLPEEVEALSARVQDARAVAAVVRTYGATVPGSFGGEYIDPATGTVVALFVGDTAPHVAALRRELHPAASIRFQSVAYSLHELNSLMDDLVEARMWLSAVGAPLREADLETAMNRVNLLVGGLPDGGVFAIHEHLGAPPMMLNVLISASVLAELPRGSVAGQLVNEAGEFIGIRGLEVRAVGDVQAYEPDGGVGINTLADGTFAIPRLAQMGWSIEILRLTPGEPETVIGRAHIVVTGGQETYVEIPIATP